MVETQVRPVQPRPKPQTTLPFPGWATLRPGPMDGLDAGEDARLIAQVADGQAGALAELYRRRGGALLRFIQRILRDAPDAEEILQDALVAIWRRAGRYDAAKASPLGWMMMIARGLALDRLRQRSRRAAGMDRLRSAEASDSPAADPDTTSFGADPDDRHHRLGNALGSLPEAQRRAIELAFYRGCTQEEIARTTGEPLGTIKARIRRGMIALRLRLQTRHD